MIIGATLCGVCAKEISKCDDQVITWYESNDESNIVVFVFFNSVDEELAKRLDELGYSQQIYEEEFDEVIKPMIEEGTYIYPGQNEAVATTVDEVKKKYNEVKTSTKKEIVNEIVGTYLSEIDKEEKEYTILYTAPSIVVEISKEELEIFENHSMVDRISYYGKPSSNNKVYDASYFTDLDVNEWYYNVVDKVIQLKLMGNIVNEDSINYFEPDAPTSRGMIVTILRNLSEEKVDGYENKFQDVEDGSWYTGSIAWANGNKIVSGYSNGMFGPDDLVKREDLAIMLYNYAKYKGYDLTITKTLEGFDDQSSVSSYAKKSIEWCVSNGIISGSVTGDGIYLNPIGNATRAEIAKMIYKMHLLSSK